MVRRLDPLGLAAQRKRPLNLLTIWGHTVVMRPCRQPGTGGGHHAAQRAGEVVAECLLVGDAEGGAPHPAERVLQDLSRLVTTTSRL